MDFKEFYPEPGAAQVVFNRVGLGRAHLLKQEIRFFQDGLGSTDVLQEHSGSAYEL